MAAWVVLERAVAVASGDGDAVEVAAIAAVETGVTEGMAVAVGALSVGVAETAPGEAVVVSPPRQAAATTPRASTSSPRRCSTEAMVPRRPLRCTNRERRLNAHATG